MPGKLSEANIKESFKKNGICDITEYYITKTYLKTKGPHYGDEARLMKY